MTWIGDHPPRQVHVYGDRGLVLKWDLENEVPMEGMPVKRILDLIRGAPAGGPAVKIRRVAINRRKKTFDVDLGRSRYSIAFARLDPRPTADDPVEEANIDPRSRARGSCTGSRRGPRALCSRIKSSVKQKIRYLRRILLHRVTVEARDRLTASGICKRGGGPEAGRLSRPALPAARRPNQRKSVDQMLRLLQVLDCGVDLVVRSRRHPEPSAESRTGGSAPAPRPREDFNPASPPENGGRLRRAEGMRRSRFPVAANRAFATAGATGGTPGSPTPPGFSVLGTMKTSTAGIASRRSIW